MCKLLAIFGCDLALLGTKIGFVANNDNRDPVDGLCVCVVSMLRPWSVHDAEWTHKVVKDLVANDARHLEALLAGDRVDDHVAMDTDKVL